MPRLIRSRDLSLLQPVPNRSSRPIPNTKILLFIGIDIESQMRGDCATPSTSRRLLSQLNLRRHQSDLVHLGALGDIDRIRDSLKFQIRIALYENDPLRPGLED